METPCSAPPEDVANALALLRQAYQRIQLAAQGAALGAGGWILAAQLGASSTSWLRTLWLLGLLAYLVGKAFQVNKAKQANKQLLMEARFVQQPLGPDRLRACMNRRSHVWMHSCIFRGLRAAVARPLPLLMSSDEKRSRLRNRYSRALAPLHVSRFCWSLPCLLLCLVAWLPALPSPSGAPIALLLGVLPAWTIFCEGAQTGLQWRLHQHFVRMDHALSAWILSEAFTETLCTSTTKLYVHHVLYQTRPWFAHSRPTRRSLSTARPSSFSASDTATDLRKVE